MVSHDPDGRLEEGLSTPSYPVEDLREPQGPQHLISDGKSWSHSRLRKRKKKVSATSIDDPGAVPTGSVAVFGVDPTTSSNIFGNLILAEDSLRQQYIALQKSRRNGLVFFSAAVACAAYLTVVVVWRASIYHWFRILERLLMVAAYITLGLFFLTGLARNVFVTAPNFLNETNKGLKDFNLKLVKAQTSFRESIIRLCVNPVYMDRRSGLVKLVLGPRSFSSQSVEAWEVYREEFWAREERRLKRKQIKSNLGAVGPGPSSLKRTKR